MRRKPNALALTGVLCSLAGGMGGGGLGNVWFHHHGCWSVSTTLAGAAQLQASGNSSSSCFHSATWREHWNIENILQEYFPLSASRFCALSGLYFAKINHLCLMSSVLYLMSCVLCLMSYDLCLMSYVLCLMSYVLFLEYLYSNTHITHGRQGSTL